MGAQHTFSSIAVANWFILKGLAEEISITQMKLQKLVYFANGLHLAVYDTPLIDQEFEAWKYGPVIPMLYQFTRKYGSQSIKQPLTLLDVNGNYTTPLIPENSSKSKSAHSILNLVWELFGSLDGFELSKLTHRPNTPWSKSFEEAQNNGIENIHIPNALIKEYYKQFTL